MSENVYYVGKIKKIEGSVEEICKKIHKEDLPTEYYDSWEELIAEEYYNDFVIINDSVYKILEKTDKDLYGDIFKSRETEDGIIEFEVLYYNGGCGFEEALEKALNNKTLDKI